MRAQKRAERTGQDLPFCHNEPLNNEVLGETNDNQRSSNAKKCGKEPQYNETSLQRTYSASPTALPFVISTFHCILFLDPRSLRNKRFRASSSRKLGSKKKILLSLKLCRAKIRLETLAKEAKICASHRTPFCIFTNLG